MTKRPSSGDTIRSSSVREKIAPSQRESPGGSAFRQGDPLKILGLATSYPKSSTDDTAPFIRSICHGLTSQGHRVDLLIPEHPNLSWENGDPPVSLHTFRYLPGWTDRKFHVWGYGEALESDEILRRSAAAILPLASVTSFYSLFSLARQFKPDVLHLHWGLPNALIGAVVSGVLGVPTVVSLHGSGIYMGERHSLLRPPLRVALASASEVTACSSDLAKRAVSLGAPDRRTHVIPYGVDLQDFRPGTAEDRRSLVRDLDVPVDGPVILAVGRLVTKKGFRHLIDAAARLLKANYEFTVLIAGDGDLRQNLERRIQRRGVGSIVHLLGRVERRGVQQLFRGVDILVVPSVRDAAGNVDGLPNVLLEGFASGLAVVASHIAGIPDVVDHGENGLLVTPGDEVALADALASLLRDQDLRRNLGTAARHRAATHHPWNSISEEYAGVLRSAARGRP